MLVKYGLTKKAIKSGFGLRAFGGKKTLGINIVLKLAFGTLILADQVFRMWFEINYMSEYKHISNPNIIERV